MATSQVPEPNPKTSSPAATAGVPSRTPTAAAPEEIDITTATRLRSVLLEATAPGHATLVVDMSQTQFCDSAGLNVLVRAHQRAEAKGGEVRLVISTTDVRRIFTVTGIDRVIPSFPSLEQALAPTAAPVIHPPAAG
jgi:anti-sigma B factor antagonist